MKIIILFLAVNVLIIDYYIIKRDFKRKIKGSIGESKVLSLSRNLGKDYLILNNLFVKGNYGFNQIDQVIISKYGIFAIEVKNYNGVITGSEFSESWFQKVGNKTIPFRNPHSQNYGHCITVIECLEKLPKEVELAFRKNVFSIVVFSDSSVLNVTTKNICVNFYDFQDAIKSFNKEIFSDKQVKLMYNLLSKKNVKSKKLRNLHKKQVDLKAAEYAKNRKLNKRN